MQLLQLDEAHYLWFPLLTYSQFRTEGPSGKQMVVESPWSTMGESRSLLLFLLFLDSSSQLWAFPFSPSLDLDVTPRTTVFATGERQRATCA